MPLYFPGFPASPANSVQFNKAGAFGGDANLTWVPASGLTVTGGKYVQASGSANSLQIAGSAAGLPATLIASGSDAEVSIKLGPKGVGFVQLGPDSYGPSFGQLVDITYTPLAPGGGSAPNGTVGLSIDLDVEDVAGAVLIGHTVGVGTSDSTTNNADYVQAGAYYSFNRLKVGRTLNLQEAVFAQNLHTGGGLSTKSAAVHIGPPIISGGSTITELNGLWIEDQTGAVTNYAIKAGAGLVQLGTLTASRPVFTDASKNLVSGSAGATAGPFTVITAIQVVNGIVTVLTGS